VSDLEAALDRIDQIHGEGDYSPEELSLDRPFRSMDDELKIDVIARAMCLRGLAQRTWGDLGKEIGISAQTFQRWRNDERVKTRYRAMVFGYLDDSRAEVARALVTGAREGDHHLQQIYWKLLGELTDKKQIEMVGSGGGPVQVDVRTVNLDLLSLETKRAMLRELEAGGEAIDVESTVVDTDGDIRSSSGNGDRAFGPDDLSNVADLPIPSYINLEDYDE